MTTELKCRCKNCGHEWTDVISPYVGELHHVPKCPACDPEKIAFLERQEALKQNATFGIGGSNVSKAVDKTDRILREDYGVTNWKDKIEVGEPAAIPVQNELTKLMDKMPSDQATQMLSGMQALTRAERQAGHGNVTDLHRASVDLGITRPTYQKPGVK